MIKKIALLCLIGWSITMPSDNYIKPIVISAAVIATLYCTYHYYVQHHAVKNPGTPIAFNSESNSQVITIFAHGIADAHKQVDEYINRGIITTTGYTFDFPDSTESIFRVNHAESSLAQQSEMECLQNVIEHAALQNQEIILYGLSRGASTIVNLLAHYSNPHIKAVILESPFDSMQTVTRNIIQRIGGEKIPGITTIADYAVETIFRKYRTTGIQPIDSITAINKQLPILIICSKEDQLVPYKSSLALYKALINNGHTKTRILITEQGKHSKIIMSRDGDQVKKTIKQWYDHYKKL